MEPINLVVTTLTYTFAMAQQVGTGSLGDTYSLNLHSWRTTRTEVRGEFYYSRTQKYESPDHAILPLPIGSFLTIEQHGLLNEDGSVEIVASRESREPFPITEASRENWRCIVPGPNGPLARISKTSDFKLRVVATMPNSSRMLETLGGWCRFHVAFPDSRLASSPCNSTPDLTGQNIFGNAPRSYPRTEPVHVRPAVTKGTPVIPWSARAVIQPQRVNWVYWDGVQGFGPMLVFECYGPAPKKPYQAPAE